MGSQCLFVFLSRQVMYYLSHWKIIEELHNDPRLLELPTSTAVLTKFMLIQSHDSHILLSMISQ